MESNSYVPMRLTDEVADVFARNTRSVCALLMEYPSRRCLPPHSTSQPCMRWPGKCSLRQEFHPTAAHLWAPSVGLYRRFRGGARPIISLIPPRVLH
ncbi:hypothetical protein B0H19DRAFT_588233 [Mycena capillaripes]|nr:hypothetical protein B0H19DRAFT_588233 [Mycena capillaripes]